MKFHRQITNELIGQKEIEMFKKQNHERKGKLPVKWKHFSDICRK